MKSSSGLKLLLAPSVAVLLHERAGRCRRGHGCCSYEWSSRCNPAFTKVLPTHDPGSKLLADVALQLGNNLLAQLNSVLQFSHVTILHVSPSFFDMLCKLLCTS